MNSRPGMSEATYHREAKFSQQKGHACMHVWMGGYVGVNGRLSEQNDLMSHMKCKQKGVNGRHVYNTNTSTRTQLCYHLARMSKVPSLICQWCGCGR